MILSNPAKAIWTALASHVYEKGFWRLFRIFFLMQFVLGIMQVSHKVGVTNNIAAVRLSLWIEQQSLDADTGFSLPVN